jgi:DNA-binding SARP family transcriptional activator
MMEGIMPQLRICTLGYYSVSIGTQQASGFESTKVRALLVYLAVEADRPHSRETLAALLWPDYPQSSALTSLRNALANLRQTIGDRSAQPPYLLITREAIQFNPASEYWLDMAEFNNGLLPMRGGRSIHNDPVAIDGLCTAITLVHGRFLEGFSIPDSAPFEEWALLKREQLNREVMQALRKLANYFEAIGDYNQALPFAWKQVELERWQEEGHQQLMRLLALSGRRSEALAQYETCTQMRKKDLGIAPSGVTTALYEGIRDGKLTPGLTKPLEELPFP